MVIFDIDGTLTEVFKEPSKIPEVSTYAFWDLITERLVPETNKLRLKALTDAWGKREDKGAGEDFIRSSTEMLQSSIELFEPGMTGDRLQAVAKAITVQMIEAGVIRPGAIESLVKCIDAGFICVLSTGSYEDGARGFLEALVEKEKLTPGQASQVYVSGATIDWTTETPKVIHHNVGENKIKGLEATLKKHRSVLSGRVKAVFVDDPLGNDSGLCSLLSVTPHLVGVVVHHKNESHAAEFESVGYKLMRSWAESTAISSFAF